MSASGGVEREALISQVALFRHLPALAGVIPWARLGDWPTPIEAAPELDSALGAAPGRDPIYIKREDRSSAVYGGNKVRTLEPMMGYALAQRARTLWATGAYGSNHVVATALHSARVGLRAGALLFPQPPSRAARANVGALLATRVPVRALPTVVALPAAMWWLRRRESDALVMAPGAAGPRGALGALSAALELAEQVAHGVCPAPSRIVLAVGSTCTTAGLLAGLHLAAQLGVGFGAAIPQVIAVRVTPWPITSRLRIARLSYRAGRLVTEQAARSGDRRAPRLRPPPFTALLDGLTVVGDYLGSGYGHPTAAGAYAAALFADAAGLALDQVYSGKSAAKLCALVRAGAPGPSLFWATKSSAPLVHPQPADIAAGPRRLQTWLGRADLDAEV